MDKTNLPPLPEPEMTSFGGPGDEDEFGTDFYTAEQMHEYAARAVREAVPGWRYRYLLTLIDAAAADGDGMAGLAYSSQLPLEYIDGKRESEIAEWLCDIAAPTQDQENGS